LFTGIVEGQGQVVSMSPLATAYRFVVDLGSLASDVRQGDSVALDGTCLTAVAIRGTRVEFDVISETVERTAFAQVRVGDKVNVERSMPANGRFHGHIVSGHVDGTARMKEKRADPRQTWITIEAKPELLAQMIWKGSICVDGVSLTIAELTRESFSVAVIPHTLAVTTLGTKGPGSLVNLEVDQIGKWMRRIVTDLISGGQPSPAPGAAAPGSPLIVPSRETLGLTFDALRRYGLGD
jgi:riboflavin synthase